MMEKSSELAQIKVDALMFFRVYSDLVTQAKSKKLDKSVIHTCIIWSRKCF